MHATQSDADNTKQTRTTGIMSSAAFSAAAAAAADARATTDDESLLEDEEEEEEEEDDDDVGAAGGGGRLTGPVCSSALPPCTLRAMPPALELYTSGGAPIDA